MCHCYGNDWNCHWCNESDDGENERRPGCGVIPRRGRDYQRSEYSCGLSTDAKNGRYERGTDSKLPDDHRHIVALVHPRQLFGRGRHHRRTECGGQETEKQHARYDTQRAGFRLPG